ncbi:MAG: cytidine deaminase [Prolixibacteraceae bacterium]|jgi:cytidine deaminase|nr:cytidine deaminase [Prolixibacteraceae bacterium]MDD4754588.1 cytidine deaminase [Prolixibacteraceae bacterium]NLO01943.1 cytidine deaminase [Bacteroidales bacterium]
MRTIEKRIIVYEYSTIWDLPAAEQKLLMASREAALNSYSPYSKFNVGAAVLLDNNEIITGNNQENAAFSESLCAERVALFYANSCYKDIPVRAIAVTASNSQGITHEPVKPCGSCRQALMETEVRFNQPVRIILEGRNKIQVFDGVDNLLPFAFKPDSLG